MSWTANNALTLARASNLPTVWTNVLAGVVLAGASATTGQLLMLVLALSLAYTGGMFLNDAADADIDARERPERPIPAGDVSRESVLLASSAMLLLAFALVHFFFRSAAASVSMVGLIAAIVVYNYWHKGNRWAPLIMGLCRVMVYLTAGLAVGEFSWALALGAAALLLYLTGLTAIASQENHNDLRSLRPLALLLAPLLVSLLLVIHALAHTHPGSGLAWMLAAVAFSVWLFQVLDLLRSDAVRRIPRAVGAMLAGLCLVDALMIASQQGFALVMVAFVGFVLTLLLQRVIVPT